MSSKVEVYEYICAMPDGAEDPEISGHDPWRGRSVNNTTVGHLFVSHTSEGAEDPWLNGNDPWTFRHGSSSSAQAIFLNESTSEHHYRPFARHGPGPAPSDKWKAGGGGRSRRHEHNNDRQNTQLSNWYAELCGQGSIASSSWDSSVTPAYPPSMTSKNSHALSVQSSSGRGKHLLVPAFQGTTKFGNPHITASVTAARSSNSSPWSERQEAVCKQWLEKSARGQGEFSNLEVFSDDHMIPESPKDSSCSSRSLEEPFLLLHERDDLAYVVCHCRGARERGWVRSDSLRPSSAYEFLVTVQMEPGQRTGLQVGKKDRDKQHIEGLFVFLVESHSVFGSWNERCRQSFPRDQLLPGDLIVGVNDARVSCDAQKRLQAIRHSSSSQIVKLHVLRLSAPLLFDSMRQKAVSCSGARLSGS